jgi:putative transposase
MESWSEANRITLQFIRTGKPVENAFIESFNGRLRDECLNANWFLTTADARRKIQRGLLLITKHGRTAV